MAAYIQKLVLNFKNLFLPFVLILYTHRKKKKSMEINPEEDDGKGVKRLRKKKTCQT